MRDRGKGARKILLPVLAGCLIVLVNGCGFPVYNLNRKWPLPITVTYLFTTIYGAVFCGRFLAKSFPGTRGGFITLLAAALACVGLGCRFLLELGEVSNTYNFTLPNILLHVFAFLWICMQAWTRAARRYRAED